jgi:hypothetical protein
VDKISDNLSQKEGKSKTSYTCLASLRFPKMFLEKKGPWKYYEVKQTLKTFEADFKWINHTSTLRDTKTIKASKTKLNKIYTEYSKTEEGYKQRAELLKRQKKRYINCNEQ